MQTLVEGKVDLVRAVFPYACTDQAKGLAFPERVVLLVVERSDDGWCRGFAAGKQGWFPASYVEILPLEKLLKDSIDPNHLAVLLQSHSWTVYATQENKVYFVNNATKETSWIIPSLGTLQNHSPSLSRSNPSPTPPITTQNELTVGYMNGGVTKRRLTREKSKRPKQQVINGLTFVVEGGEPQDLLNPLAPSYIDHFWRDKNEQTGFDVIREKHINGKFAVKEMAEFIKERAIIEEQYARSLAKLSKSTLGDNEEGTLHKAWLALKAETRERSETHSKFASQLGIEVEKPLIEFKESQKITRKEHEYIVEKSRKQVQVLDTSVEKARICLSSGKDNVRGLLRRQSSISDVKSGEDMMRLEKNYNQAQRTWLDNMIAACRDFEKHEEERSDFLQEQFVKYIDLCVGVQESTAEALTRATNMVEHINKKADREYFIKRNGTGTLRPVDRYVEL